MSDQLRSWLRTVVPAAWSTLVACLVTAGAPAWLTAPLGDAQDVLVVPLVLAAVYAGLRKAEPHLPPWATRVLLGSNTSPTYPTQ
ncbi:hypothetical protein [Saccharopolyspora spinosa]|uniref:Uncharacterized protein n=1 Tax=Saccharopolyspora spinosa TaxID=60894 RepID=A0A2N3YAB7_SACSN|nr:hypothetical protein [Saccharopolyspora spinosa]PKW19849.1 hypothetical protein A8926_8047 [Saccharopolyspora spinosa]